MFNSNIFYLEKTSYEWGLTNYIMIKENRIRT
jgi:hypothetical protein